MSKEKPNILFERINTIQRQLDTLINYHATMPQQQLGTNPYDFVKDASDWSTTPRNAPCPCGSGRKYKVCHGAAS